MTPVLSVFWLLLGFGVFMALIWSVHAINRSAARRYGYEPFSLPNAALMLVANLLLLSALAPAGNAAYASATGPRTLVMLGVVAVLAAGLLVVIVRRTSLWYGLYAVALMAVGAIAVFPSLVFMHFAAAAGGEPETGAEPDADRHSDVRSEQDRGGADEATR
jgi:hypothetical protein